MDLRTQLLVAEADVERIRREIEGATCAQVGHDWRFSGARNAGCSRGGCCSCSVPVHTCAKCGECDYGTREAEAEVIADCELTSLDEGSSATTD